MSRTIPFHFVDVFAVEPLTGNSLAVVDGGAELALELMQNIAREFNQSETTFVLPATRANADWRLRSFTPKGVEVTGAGGHNTLGAWWWLAAAGRLDLGDGPTWFHNRSATWYIRWRSGRAKDGSKRSLCSKRPHWPAGSSQTLALLPPHSAFVPKK
ncbi:PhzF family phenazine biosynthesis protein [Mesorhizobium sp.]|uniref:PhzF family phenazine biosynthesis protein n=1 Tax=Mesorhizobium sp. TaxID=1871066 RepID=UPI0025E5B822|nr:PhzF family phenazine biosynthesis protein [Mesorhizobium sp.]